MITSQKDKQLHKAALIILIALFSFACIFLLASCGDSEPVSTIKITVTIADKTSCYDQPLAALTATVTFGSIREGDEDVYTLSTTATANSDVGTYPITGQKGTNENYEVTFVDGTYEVTYGTAEVTSRKELTAAISNDNFGTAKMTADFEVNETVIIPAGRTIAFDLNGCAVTAGFKDESIGRHHYAVDNYGVLTVVDSSSGGDGIIRARGVENYATMYLRGGTLEACDDGGGAAVWNEKNPDGGDVKFEMTGGTLKTSGVNSGNNAACALVVNENTTAKISGGDLNCRLISIISQGELEIENVTLSISADKATYGYWNCVKVNSGTAILRNVTINSEYGGGLEASGGTAKLYDCTFTQSNYDTYCSMNVAASGGGVVEVNGGEYTSDGYCAYVFNSGGQITINGGTFNAKKDVFRADSTSAGFDSIINVNGGNFTGTIVIAAEKADCIIKAGTFNGVENADNEFAKIHQVFTMPTRKYTQ